MCVFLYLDFFHFKEVGREGTDKVSRFPDPHVSDIYIHRTQKEKTGYKKGKLEQRS